MQAHRTTYLAFLGLAIVVAGAIRLPDLALRPMHADEAVQAARFRKLWLSGEYRYDPNEFHGPTLSYSTLPGVWASGARSFAETDEATYRIVTALFGCAIVILAWLLADGIGRPSMLFAACLMALSPCLVFYSRYYIHETLVVFFSLAAIASAWRYVRSSQKLAWCIACGVSLGCLQATKETSVIVFGAFFVATVCAASITWRRDEQESDVGFRWSHLGMTMLVAVCVAGLLLSSFLTNLRGPVDGVLAYVPWLDRAASTSIHDHPWYFYLHRLTLWHVANGPWWSEGMILLLATVAFAVGLFRQHLLPAGVHRGLVCWLGFYSLALITVYSAIPYKTPWCMIGFLQATTLLAGVGATTLLQTFSSRWWQVAIGTILFAGLVHLGWQSYQASYHLTADPEKPVRLCTHITRHPPIRRRPATNHGGIPVRPCHDRETDLGQQLLLAATMVLARILPSRILESRARRSLRRPDHLRAAARSPSDRST